MVTRKDVAEPNSSIKIVPDGVSVVPLYLGLGSNLGDREKNIQRALKKLDKALECKWIALSDIIETEPWGFKSENKFFNAVVKYEISLPLNEKKGKSLVKNCSDEITTSNILQKNNKPTAEDTAKEKAQSCDKIADVGEKDGREIEGYAVAAHRILKICKEIERKMGRRDKPEYDAEGRRIYKSRIIDIDILLLDDIQIDEPDLKIPHPLISARPFVLNPLLQIAPELREKFL